MLFYSTDSKKESLLLVLNFWWTSQGAVKTIHTTEQGFLIKGLLCREDTLLVEHFLVSITERVQPEGSHRLSFSCWDFFFFYSGLKRWNDKHWQLHSCNLRMTIKIMVYSARHTTEEEALGAACSGAGGGGVLITQWWSATIKSYVRTFDPLCVRFALLSWHSWFSLTIHHKRIAQRRLYFMQGRESWASYRGRNGLGLTEHTEMSYHAGLNIS